jgi:hypothetical protein
MENTPSIKVILTGGRVVVLHGESEVLNLTPETAEQVGYAMGAAARHALGKGVVLPASEADLKGIERLREDVTVVRPS